MAHIRLEMDHLQVTVKKQMWANVWTVRKSIDYQLTDYCDTKEEAITLARDLAVEMSMKCHETIKDEFNNDVEFVYPVDIYVNEELLTTLLYSS